MHRVFQCRGHPFTRNFVREPPTKCIFPRGRDKFAEQRESVICRLCYLITGGVAALLLVRGTVEAILDFSFWASVRHFAKHARIISLPSCFEFPREESPRTRLGLSRRIAGCTVCMRYNRKGKVVAKWKRRERDTYTVTHRFVRFCVSE